MARRAFLSTLSQQLRHCSSAINAPASCSCVLAPFARPLPSHNRQAAGWQWSGNTWRGFSSQDTTAGSNNAAVQSFLDGISGVKLRQELQVESEQRPYMRYTELLELIKTSGAADSYAKAEEMAHALVLSGAVLHFQNVVYLRPLEVAEMVFRTLPSDPSVIHARLHEVEADLKVMEEQHTKIQAAASRWPRIWLNLGCVAVFTQLVGFAYLTWYELSWDVMEPIAYHMTLAYSFLAYVYFLTTRGAVLDHGDFKNYWEQRQRSKYLQAHGFDQDKYLHLNKLRENYRRYLAAQAEAAVDEAAARAAPQANTQ